MPNCAESEKQFEAWYTSTYNLTLERAAVMLRRATGTNNTFDAWEVEALWKAWRDSRTAPSSGAAGAGVLVGGSLVGWFADPDAAEEWAKQRHFGQWLVVPCSEPLPIPFSEEDLAQVRAQADELSLKFRGQAE